MKRCPECRRVPFANESGNPQFEYVADGVTERLITSLMRLSGLTVKVTFHDR